MTQELQVPPRSTSASHYSHWSKAVPALPRGLMHVTNGVEVVCLHSSVHFLSRVQRAHDDCICVGLLDATDSGCLTSAKRDVPVRLSTSISAALYLSRKPVCML